MTRVTVKDMRALNFCAKGSRQFAARYGLDWARFVGEGIPVSELEHIKDGMLESVIEKAKERESQNGGR